MTRHSNKLIGAHALALILMSGTAAIAGPSGTVAFLMPDQGSTRYEEHDHPGFVAEMKKLCAELQGALPERRRRRRAAAAAVQLGHLAGRQGRSCSIRSIRPPPPRWCKLAQSQGVKVIAYDRPDPRRQADFYVSFDNEGIGKAIAQSLVEHLKDEGRADRQGRRARRSTARRPTRPPA